MRTHDTDASGPGQRASRRRFFQMLAGSPLLAAAYPLFPPEWQLGVDTELRRAAAAPVAGHHPDLRRLRPGVRGDRRRR